MPQRDFIYRKVHVGSAWHLQPPDLLALLKQLELLHLVVAPPRVEVRGGDVATLSVCPAVITTNNKATQQTHI